MALSFGKPIVVSRIGEMAEFEKYCLTVEPDDSDAILEALREMRSSEVRQRYASKSRELSRKTAFPAIANEHVELYKRLIAERSVSPFL
jgi:glycosyltransferase involved in cell wall biosynthesis